MTVRRDAIVIGAGIHGCSTALHLCVRGFKPVLIEKDYAGRHASGVNAGGVRQLARDLAEIPLSIRSMAIWEDVQALVGDSCGFESHGQVLVAENEDELEACRARVSDLKLRGFAHEELIDGVELRPPVPPPVFETPDCDYAARGIVSIWSRRNWAGERWPWRSISQHSL
jgi:sarcosine oxidase, subunit beta